MSRSLSSVINADLTVVGDLDSAGDIRVAGTVDGNINSRTLIVNGGGCVNGSVMAESVRVLGTVRGRIEARSVSIAGSARVVGDIFHHELTIEEGAVLDGLRPWRPSQYFAARRPARRQAV